jgi:cold shock CspA family protein
VFVHIGAYERAEMRDLNEGHKISYEVSQAHGQVGGGQT